VKFEVKSVNLKPDGERKVSKFETILNFEFGTLETGNQGTHGNHKTRVKRQEDSCVAAQQTFAVLSSRYEPLAAIHMESRWLTL
jgi:hypothetical protein